jgi:hypothetical protein
MPRKNLVLVMSAAIIIFTGTAVSCAPRTVNAVPNLPPAYYGAVEANPQELIFAYFYAGYADYIDIREPKSRYDFQYFVFKNILIDAWVMRELDEGWLWLDLIKCPVVNMAAMEEYGPGDRIEVVGLNLGPENVHVPGLTFKDCYVLPVNAVQLPVADGPPVVPAY